MGREIRRVPPNWEHPLNKNPHDCGRFQPLFDESYLSALDEWLEAHRKWEAGEDPDREKYGGDECRYYAQWGGNPPDVEYYRPDWKEGEATWYQVYETVSEGTPITPPFETQQELIDYLVESGDFWDDPWTKEQAERFVLRTQWAPSMVLTGDGQLLDGVQAL